MQGVVGGGGPDHLTASVVQFLESHQAVCNVTMAERAPAMQRDIAAWDKVRRRTQSRGQTARESQRIIFSMPEARVADFLPLVTVCAPVPLQLHAPLRLPVDVKSFYSVSDGLHLRWSIRLQDDVLPLGNIHVNAMADMKQVRQGGQTSDRPRTSKHARAKVPCDRGGIRL